MLSKNIKKKIAVLLTGVMVLGMTVPAGAAVTGGDGVSSQGTGNFEGHVNRKVVDVTLPTVSEGTAPFSFIYDAEGLIPETKAAAYGTGYTFPETTHVYFKTADKTFGKDSTEFTVSNNSSVSVNIALKIEMEKDANAPKLVGSEGEVPADYSKTQASGDASLFLGLVVTGADATGADGTDKAGTFAVSENTVEKTFNLLGEPDNYSVSTNQVGEASYPHEYTFKKVANPTKDWKQIKFKLTGKANKVENGADLTAPNLKVTWNFAALDEEAVAANSQSSGGSTEPANTPAYALIDEEYSLWLGKDNTPSPFTGLTAKSQVTKFTVNGVDVLERSEVVSGFLKVTWANCEASGCTPAADGRYTLIATIDGVTYEATYVAE
jgi:hypothetical protein